MIPEYDICIQFFKEMDQNGSKTQTVNDFVIEIVYYYNETQI